MRQSFMKCIPAMLLTVLAVTFPVFTRAVPEDALLEARRLTWDRTTRDEGIDRLRGLLNENQQRLDVQEALGEVLSWSDETRPEGIALLREVLVGDPGRDHARLLLAEVLSWDKQSRPESERLYREQIARQPDSTDARVGLARLLSWRGDLHQSRELYLEAIRRDPADASARMGLAEVQRWSGRSRTSLRTLRELDQEGRTLPAARRQLAEAWMDLDRPVRALAEYVALLAEDPDDETTRHEIDKLRRRLRPSLEIGVWASTESGDPRTSKVEVLAFPVVWNWGSTSDWRYHAGAGVAFFDNEQGSTRRTSAGGGMEGPLGLRLRLRADAAVQDFQDGDSEFSGRLDLRVAAGERVELIFGGRRRPVTDSRLAAAGETINGVRYGPVFETSGFAGISARPGHHWDLSVRGSFGSLDGDNVRDNDREAVFAGLGHTFHPGRVSLRAGYAFAFMEYDLDLSGFPPGDLGGDGLTAPGVGGYFSPERFTNHMARLDIWWNSGERAAYFAGGGLGTQKVDDSFTQGLGQSTTSSDFYVGARWRLSPSVDLKARASRQDVASAFDRTRIELFLIRRF